ncbi:MAG TPA: rhodanese-like domain-containing protein, partial [Caldithrix abyssi]|nr:rhodanese-like domain-containing protein [Caldithrix abyssi]
GLFILFISATVALVFNNVSASGVPLLFQQASLQGKKEISLYEMKKIVDEGRITILDARYDRFYKRGHLPGAVSIPYNTTFLDSLTAGFDKGKPLITYCFSPSCPQADRLADRLREAGFTDVAVFKPGYKAWTAAQYPVEVK